MTFQSLLLGRPVHLRTRLLTPVLAASIPLAVFAALVIFLLWRHQDEQLQAGRVQTAQAIAAAIRAEIDSTLFHARYIATSPLITPRHINEFRERCVEAVRLRRDWKNIALIDPTGRQVVNTLYADAFARPNLAQVPEIRVTMASGEPTVSTSGSPRMAAPSSR